MILLFGIGLGLGLYFYGKTKRPAYTAKATVFPLTAPSENSLSGGALNNILGIESAPKSFSSEASINIIELSLSRNLRERVAVSKIAQFDNKTVTELIVKDFNEHKSFYQDNIQLPTDSASLAVLGEQLLKNSFEVKLSKNGVLEIYFTNNDKKLLTPVTNIFIGKLSQFYIDLKITKALSDYYFTINRIDSFQALLNIADKKAVNMQNSTFFTPLTKLEFSIPKENLSMERARILRQRDMAVSNREEANWRLQKATPIISILDKPAEPFTAIAPSPTLYGIVGSIIGFILGFLIVTSGLIFKYLKFEITKGFFGKEEGLDLSL